MIDDIAHEVNSVGFSLRGGFAPEIEDEAPTLADGRITRVLIMVGNAGPAMWGKFIKQRPEGDAPLDHWTRAVLQRIAKRFGALAVFPFQRPLLPFQRWQVKAEGCHFSPLGLVIHPEFGLWHAVRGALLFGEDIGVLPAVRRASPCASCTDHPCMKGCPVNTFSPKGHDVAGCLARLTTPQEKIAWRWAVSPAGPVQWEATTAISRTKCVFIWSRCATPSAVISSDGDPRDALAPAGQNRPSEKGARRRPFRSRRWR